MSSRFRRLKAEEPGDMHVVFYSEGDDLLVEVASCVSEEWADRILNALRWVEAAEEGTILAYPLVSDTPVSTGKRGSLAKKAPVRKLNNKGGTD